MGKVTHEVKGPTSLAMRLFEPGMSPMHRAGLGGLACTLRHIEEKYRAGFLTDEEIPGGPWENGIPPWEITPLEITLFFGKPQSAGEFLERLFAIAFSIKDGLIYLPAQHRNEPSPEVLVELQNGLTLTFLQHGLVRKLESTEYTTTYEVDDHKILVSFKRCSFYKHQATYSEFVNKNGILVENEVEVTGPINPGAVVRHVAFTSQTSIAEKPSLLLPLHFAIVGCLALPINRGCGVLLIPEVSDLDTFTLERPLMTPTKARECRISGGSDAALQAQVRLRAGRMARTMEVPGCYAVTFRSKPWVNPQKTRVESIFVPEQEREKLELFEIALAELPPKITPKTTGIVTKRKAEGGNKQQPSKQEENEYSWSDSVIRPLIANNLAAEAPWYRSFTELTQHKDPVNKKSNWEQISEREKEGLHKMIEKIPWKDQGESTVVRAVHEALRMRYGRINSENETDPAVRENRWKKESEKWRLAFSGSKVADQFRNSLCDLFSRAGTNGVLQEYWTEILPMLDEKRWRLTRDLSLLALASYKGKSRDAKNAAQVPAEPDQEGGKNL